jgi:hypothetical protein
MVVGSGTLNARSIFPIPIFNRMSEIITFGSRVTACDCLLTGRVSMVWALADCHHSSSHSKIRSAKVYFRVHFPPHSPFIGDWAVYRQGEIALLIEHPKHTNLNIVDLMRPKIPT